MHWIAHLGESAVKEPEVEYADLDISEVTTFTIQDGDKFYSLRDIRKGSYFEVNGERIYFGLYLGEGEFHDLVSGGKWRFFRESYIDVDPLRGKIRGGAGTTYNISYKRRITEISLTAETRMCVGAYGESFTVTVDNRGESRTISVYKSTQSGINKWAGVIGGGSRVIQL